MSETWEETCDSVVLAMPRCKPERAVFCVADAIAEDDPYRQAQAVRVAGAYIRAWIRELPEESDYVPDRPADGQGDRLLWLAMSHLAEAQLRATSLEQGMDEVSEGVALLVRKERTVAVATFLAEVEQELRSWWSVEL